MVAGDGNGGLRDPLASKLQTRLPSRKYPRPQSERNMQVLVTGGTGSIGAPVVQALRRRNHSVVAIGRSSTARDALRQLGAEAVPGDIKDPDKWAGLAATVDGVIHAAATWEDDSGDVDRNVVDAIIENLRRGNGDGNNPGAFIYTGGCWMYGATGDVVATEESPIDALPEFAWSIPIMERVISTPGIRGMLIHPAMVYERNGGVFDHIFEDARQRGYVRVIGSENVRWPLIHRDDLAELYVLMLEQGKHGDVYNAATIEGVPIGLMTRAIARRLGIEQAPVVCDVESIRSEFGDTAAGYALDQQMSGQKAMAELGWNPQHRDVFADIK
jgi:nucleoside-diphosphate-sugar epimerase